MSQKPHSWLRAAVVCITVVSSMLWLLEPGSALAAAKKAKKMARPKVAPGKPEVFELEPRGIQRGVATKVKLIGTNLVGLTELELGRDGLEGELLEDPEPTATEAWVEITAGAMIPRGSYDISVRNTNSES